MASAETSQSRLTLRPGPLRCPQAAHLSPATPVIGCRGIMENCCNRPHSCIAQISCLLTPSGTVAQAWHPSDPDVSSARVDPSGLNRCTSGNLLAFWYVAVKARMYRQGQGQGPATAPRRLSLLNLHGGCPLQHQQGQCPPPRPALVGLTPTSAWRVQRPAWFRVLPIFLTF